MLVRLVIWNNKREEIMTDTEWGEMRKLGYYFDVINGDMRQVINIEPYEERIAKEFHIDKAEVLEESEADGAVKGYLEDTPNER